MSQFGDVSQGGSDPGRKAKRGGLRPWWWAGGAAVLLAVVPAAVRYLTRPNSEARENFSGYVTGVLITLGFAVAGLLLVLLVARVRAARLRFEGPVDARALLAALSTPQGVRRGITALHPAWIIVAAVPGSMLALASIGAFIDGQPIPAIVIAVVVLVFVAALVAIAVSTRRGLASRAAERGYLARIVTVPTQLPGTALRVYLPVDQAGEVGSDVEARIATLGLSLSPTALGRLARRDSSPSLLAPGMRGWPPVFGLTETRDRPFLDGLWLVLPTLGHGGATMSARAYGVRVGALSRHVQRGGLGRRSTKYDIRS